MLLQIAMAVSAVVLTVVLLRGNINIGIIMLINSVFVILATGMPAGNIVKTFIKGAVSEKTIGIIVILVVIMMIENIMRNTGMIKQMVTNLKKLIRSRKAAAIILPAVLGLLPSPGGARFSCPMVEEVLSNSAPQHEKAFMNFWFRHIWIDGFILYPGVILASELSNIPVIKLFLHLLIFNAIHVVIGIFFISSRVKKDKVKRQSVDRREHIIGFAKNFFPIAFIICVYLVLLNVVKYSLQIAGLATVVMLIVYKRYRWREVKKLIKEAFSFKYVMIVLGVMVFNEFLSSSGVIDSWINAVTYYKVPQYVLFVLLPFIGGFTSGLALSFVSVTFPILIPLGLDKSIWNVVIAYVSGFSGVMSTPLHLCGVMSADYFGVSISTVFKKAAFAEIFMLAVVISLIVIGYVL